MTKKARKTTIKIRRAPKKIARKPKPLSKAPMHAYVLLDRSGSMLSQWSEAINAVNTYAGSLAENPETAKSLVTLAVFDGYHGGTRFHVLRNALPADEWNDISRDEVTPDGMTPLYDATMRLIARAESENPERAVVVVMTDGDENASRNATHWIVKCALDRLRARGWQIIFLGANFDNYAQANSLGTGWGQTLSVTPHFYGAAMRGLASSSVQYSSVGNPINFTQQAKASLGDAHANDIKTTQKARAA